MDNAALPLPLTTRLLRYVFANAELPDYLEILLVSLIWLTLTHQVHGFSLDPLANASAAGAMGQVY